MRFEVLILGNSSATPMFERHPSAQVLNFNEQLFLIDCGEGTQMQLYRYGIKSNKLSHVFISHLHGDHYLGLVGLLSSMHLMGRKTDLHLYGPAPLQDILQIQFLHSDTQLNYNLIFHPTNPNEQEVILKTPMLTVTSFPLTHRVPCTGFRFDEGRRAASLNMPKVEALRIPSVYYQSIKKGIDYQAPDGRVLKAEELTYPAPPSRSYAYCSDTKPVADYLPSIQGCSLLYHEATFLHEMAERAQQTFHTTALEAATVAQSAQVNQLLLGHYSARYRDLTPLLTEAKTVFDQTFLSIEGKWFLV